MSIVAEFVTLTNHPIYEILTVYPYTIRRRDNHHVVVESTNNQKHYTRLLLNGKKYQKHRIIAEQFIPNPNNLPEIDHINHDKNDNRIENLRWCSSSDNQKNKASYNGVNALYVDEIHEDSLVVDHYNQHSFEGYYYYDNTFYFYNGIQYRVLHVCKSKSNKLFVHMTSTEHKNISVYYTQFKQQYDLI